MTQWSAGRFLLSLAMLLPGCTGKDAVLLPAERQEERGSFQVLLPRVARTSSREVYTGLLGDFLTQSAAFLMPRGQ